MRPTPLLQRLRHGSVQRGFTVIELLLALVVGISVMALGVEGYRRYTDHLLTTNAAEQARAVARSVRLYVADKQTEIANRINAPQTAIDIAWDKVVQAGYAPHSVKSNVYRQTYQIGVRKTANGQLETLLVTAGGQHIADQHLLSIAQKIGAAGGAILHDNPGLAQGAFKGWQVKLEDYGLAPSGPGGHVAVALFVMSDNAGAGGKSPNQINDDVLYRKAMPNSPDANAMKAPLRVAGSKDINPTWGERNFEGNDDTGMCNSDKRTWGRLVANIDGTLMACRNGKWRKASEGQWRDPVADFAALPKAGNGRGDVRVIIEDSAQMPRAYVWRDVGTQGGEWIPLSIDRNGDMRVPGKILLDGSQAITSGQPCDPSRENLAVDASKNVNVCFNKGGAWSWAPLADKTP